MTLLLSILLLLHPDPRVKILGVVWWFFNASVLFGPVLFSAFRWTACRREVPRAPAGLEDALLDALAKAGFEPVRQRPGRTLLERHRRTFKLKGPIAVTVLSKGGSDGRASSVYVYLGRDCDRSEGERARAVIDAVVAGGT